MEYEILNEILTITVGNLFDPSQLSSVKQRIRSSKLNTSIDSTEPSQRNSNVSQKPIQKNEGIVTKESNVRKLEDLLDYWVSNEGTKLFQQSLHRLKLDLSKLSRKEMEKMSYETLNVEKRKIKHELKNYDMIFKGTFKRLPMKNEKEPMRPLYMYYKTIKEILHKYTQGLKKAEENSSPLPGIKKEQGQSNSVNNNNTIKTQEIMKKLVELKKKRDELKDKFQKYHSNFLKNNNRKIKYAQDIAPIEQEYQLYKNLKNEIAKLESYLVL